MGRRVRGCGDVPSLAAAPVNGQPAGRMSTNRQYQKPFCLFAEPICRDGAAMVVIEVFLTNQDGVPIVPATTKRWVAMDQLTLTPAAR